MGRFAPIRTNSGRLSIDNWRLLIEFHSILSLQKHTFRINGGELFERVIDDDFELTEKVCTIFMRQICEGVQYMHEKYIMHLDMKPENILCVTRTGNRIKLIDFGLARRYDPNRMLQVMFGTPDFAAPEVLSYERVTPAADMWSVGVICYVLLSGLSPFMGNSDLETMTNVTKAIYDFDDESFEPISEEAKDFIAKLLIKDPTKRLKPSECLNHKWLAKTKVGKTTQLSKTKLKKYVVRRRWQKAVTAIMALSRMGANLSLTGGAATGVGAKPAATSSRLSQSSPGSNTSGTKCSRTTQAKKSSTSTTSSSSSIRLPNISNNRMIISTNSTKTTTSSGTAGNSTPATQAGRLKTSSSSKSSSSTSSTTSSYRVSGSTGAVAAARKRFQ